MRKPSSCLTVLVVDDDSISGMWLSAQIKAHGHQVWCACSGIEALVLSEQHCFDLIMTDCYMQGMSGFELTQTLRQRLTKRKVTIIGMTASNSSVELNRGIAAGMDECLTKPLSKEKIRKLIHDGELQSISSSSYCAKNVHAMRPNISIKNNNTPLRALVPELLYKRFDRESKMNLEWTYSSNENIQLRQVPINLNQAKWHHLEDISFSACPDNTYKEESPVAPRHAFLQAIWHTNGIDMRALENAIASQDSTHVAHLAHKLRGIALVAGRADIADVADKVEKACQHIPVHALTQQAKKLRLSLANFNRDILAQLRCVKEAPQ